MDITINLVEVASELAHERTLNELVAQELIKCGDEMWLDKEFVQDEFNNWYDYYYNIIETFKQ